MREAVKSFLVLLSKEEPTFRVALGSPFVSASVAAIPPPAALCARNLGNYLLFVSGLRNIISLSFALVNRLMKFNRFLTNISHIVRGRERGRFETEEKFPKNR